MRFMLQELQDVLTPFQETIVYSTHTFFHLFLIVFYDVFNTFDVYTVSVIYVWCVINIRPKMKEEINPCGKCEFYISSEWEGCEDCPIKDGDLE